MKRYSSYKHCKFQSSVYATFNAHLSKKHNGHDWRMLKPEIVSGQSDENESEGQEQVSFDEIETEDNEGESADSADVTHSDLANQLEHNLAGLFLKMQSILLIRQVLFKKSFSN